MKDIPFSQVLSYAEPLKEILEKTSYLISECGFRPELRYGTMPSGNVLEDRELDNFLNRELFDENYDYTEYEPSCSHVSPIGSPKTTNLTPNSFLKKPRELIKLHTLELPTSINKSHSKDSFNDLSFDLEGSTPPSIIPANKPKKTIGQFEPPLSLLNFEKVDRHDDRKQSTKVSSNEFKQPLTLSGTNKKNIQEPILPTLNFSLEPMSHAPAPIATALQPQSEAVTKPLMLNLFDNSESTERKELLSSQQKEQGDSNKCSPTTDLETPTFTRHTYCLTPIPTQQHFHSKSHSSSKSEGPFSPNFAKEKFEPTPAMGSDPVSSPLPKALYEEWIGTINKSISAEVGYASGSVTAAKLSGAEKRVSNPKQSTSSEILERFPYVKAFTNAGSQDNIRSFAQPTGSGSRLLTLPDSKYESVHRKLSSSEFQSANEYGESLLNQKPKSPKVGFGNHVLDVNTASAPLPIHYNAVRNPSPNNQRLSTELFPARRVKKEIIELGISAINRCPIRLKSCTKPSDTQDDIYNPLQNKLSSPSFAESKIPPSRIQRFSDSLSRALEITSRDDSKRYNPNRISYQSVQRLNTTTTRKSQEKSSNPVSQKGTTIIINSPKMNSMKNIVKEINLGKDQLKNIGSGHGVKNIYPLTFGLKLSSNELSSPRKAGNQPKQDHLTASVKLLSPKSKALLSIPLPKNCTELKIVPKRKNPSVRSKATEHAKKAE